MNSLSVHPLVDENNRMLFDSEFLSKGSIL